MQGMIERVARAIARELFPALPPDKEKCELIARAAIAAMREPTEAMYDAGCGAEDKNLIPENGGICGFVWQAMIDAALEEK